MAKLGLNWQKIIKGEGQDKLTYYSTNCPKCGQELRVHQLGQRRVAEGLHILNCVLKNDTR